MCAKLYCVFCANRLLLSEYAHRKMFIEIETGQIGKDKNVIIGVIYRLPDTEIKIFHEYVSELIDKIRSENKRVVCLGYYDISLLNSDCHGPTQEFAILV